MFDPKRIRNVAELKSDEKTAGIFSLMGALYTLIAGFVILIFSAQVPELAMSTLNFIIMFSGAGIAIMMFGLVRYRHEYPDENKFLPVLIVGSMLVVVIQFLIRSLGGITFNTVFSAVLPVGILAFFLVTQASFVEEVVFAGLFQTASVALVPRLKDPTFKLAMDIGLIAMLSFVFMLYHGAVYGTNPTALATVFMARVIYSVAYAYTDNLDAPFILHFINNAAAGLYLLGLF